ncbi:hypothetical protein [Rugosimonospora africana]|nr:hypothetical protein [Rugosimonospora africana]
MATPVRLRLLAGSAILLAAALLAVTTAGMVQTRQQVRVIGEQAAPQAATASDLYLALSDLDSQVARLIMIGNSDELSASRLDALLTYQRRSAEVDADLSRAQNAAVTEATRAQLGTLATQLALYRQLAWQALAVQDQATDQAPGRPPADTLGYYARANTLLHADLLPTAKALRAANQATLERSYARQRTIAWWGVGLAVLFGTAGVVLLVALQWRLTRSFRRLVNPALALATLATAGLVVSAGVVFVSETHRLDSAQRTSFAPFLALTAAQAVSYDAAGDTSRYLISADPGDVQQDVATKSRCVIDGGACGRGGDDLTAGLNDLGTAPTGTGPDALDRWNAYQRDHNQIVALADGGKLSTAVDRLTGIARGDAAFDFFYYDTAVSQVTASREASFEDAITGARGALSGWTVIPAVLMGAVMLLVLVGIRPRLAEYR